jgi:hypothetical protein
VFRRADALSELVILGRTVSRTYVPPPRGFRDLTHHIAGSLLETGGFRHRYTETAWIAWRDARRTTFELRPHRRVSDTSIDVSAEWHDLLMLDASASTVSSLVNRISPADELGAQHKAEALDWLARTTDIYRRVQPRTRSPHLVSYFLLADRAADSVLLCDHRLSGLWLPTGGHVEPGEHPVETVRREAAEELGIEAQFDPTVGLAPFFLTVTETVGGPEMRHTDVSL